ncbi:MAG: ERAP1-like C-terminal domain-containing protein [Polyangiaceae bacterium]
MARFDALVRAATTLTEPHDRIAALRALGAFDDPNLVSRALDFAVDPQVTLKDSRYVLEGALRHRSSIAVVLSWIEANWERAVRRYEGPAARRLIDVVSVLCDRRSIDDARAFYKAHPVEAGAHRLEHALQEASRCAELAETLGPAIAKALPAASPVTTVGSKRGPTPK